MRIYLPYNRITLMPLHNYKGHGSSLVKTGIFGDIVVNKLPTYVFP